jgi:hypothetical protein
MIARKLRSVNLYSAWFKKGREKMDVKQGLGVFDD